MTKDEKLELQRTRAEAVILQQHCTLLIEAIEAHQAGAEAQALLLHRWQARGSSRGMTGNVLTIAVQIVKKPGDPTPDGGTS